MRSLRLAPLLALVTTQVAHAAEPPPVLYPIYAFLPGSLHNAEAERLFSEGVARYRLGTVEVMDIPPLPAPRAPALLAAGKAELERRAFPQAAAALDEAAAETIATGGAGLGTAELADLFICQAMATQAGAPPETMPARAKEAYLRAAAVAPDRVLEEPRFPPAVIAAWRAARAEVTARPRGTIVIKASASAEITVDGGPTRLAPATVPDLAYGEHFVRVTDVGHQPWAQTVLLALPSLPIDAPVTAPQALDDAAAAAHARRTRARFALVATLHTGPPLELELAMVDAATGQRRDSAVVPFAAGGALDDAVMRLDEEARRADLLGTAVAGLPDSDVKIGTVPPSPPIPGPRLADDPSAWARAHWPLVTAVGVTVATALLLGIAVAADSRPPH